MVFDSYTRPIGDPGIGENEVIGQKEKTRKREVYLVKNSSRARSTYPERVKIDGIHSG